MGQLLGDDLPDVLDRRLDDHLDLIGPLSLGDLTGNGCFCFCGRGVCVGCLLDCRRIVRGRS